MPRDIMIACVTVEVAMVVSPVLRYKPQELHLFRFIRDPGSRKSKLYRDHYNEVVRKVSASLPRCRTIEHSSIEITLESYVRADPRKLKTATNSVDDALFG
ncbi:hypothetical protein [Methanomethylophilus alvi]|uniref:hypothetical protein n=1 Tax=Methanomethylophilus alvi TaxID=1291540 RepID=UPI0037DC1CB3